VVIQSPDPMAPPEIRPNTLTHPHDREVAARIFRFVRKLAADPLLSRWIVAEIQPGASVRTDDEIIDAFLTLGANSLHAVGTCRMGDDPAAVVDERLRVRGLTGLRVADCSVMPHNCSGAGGTSAPAMGLGWRAADIIMEDHNDAV